MQQLHYGAHVLDIADDLAALIMDGASDLANDGKVVNVPVAAYVAGEPGTVSLLIGAGIPLFLAPARGDQQREDPPETLESFSWLRDYLTTDYGPYPLVPATVNVDSPSGRTRASYEDVEAAAVAAMDEIAQLIIDRCEAVSHWGGDTPFDGVIESIHKRVLSKLDGH
jgi:hypothetical protein